MPMLRAIHALCLGAVLATAGALWSVAAAADAAQALRPVRAPDTPTFLDDGDVASLRAAIRQSLAWLERQPSTRRLVFGPRVMTASEQGRSLRRLLDLLADDPAPEVLEERVLREFDVLTSVGRSDGTVLLTGYHEPVIDADEIPSSEYSVPILGVPKDLVRESGARYLSRAEIEDGRLVTPGLALAWARDPVDVFFMEVEGSGTLRLRDGREIRIGHATTNRHPYRSVGRLLIDERKIEEDALSMQAIRAWLAAHPAERARVLRYNASYVFFHRLTGPPVGSLGVPLTPERSIATDARIFPPAALAFVRTGRPRFLADGGVAWGPVSRFVLNQDTGGAIRGPGRVDIFWGRGPEADLAAGLMKELGELYFLVPKPGPNVAIGPLGR